MPFECFYSTSINGHHLPPPYSYHPHDSLLHWQLPHPIVRHSQSSSLSCCALSGHRFCARRLPPPPPFSTMGLLQEPPQHECPVDDRLPYNSLANAPLRVLCLHGFRTSGDIMQRQLHKWDRSVLDLLDPIYLDAPFPALGKSDVEGFFPPPYYEWFQFERTETNVTYSNLEECIEFISNYMEKHGPFDGLIGFSQGAFLSAALAGMQQQGLALTSVPPLRFVIIISGGVLSGEHKMKGCYSEPIICPALHLIGENDFLKAQNEELVTAFKDPVVIRHGARHTVPRLGSEELSTIRNFLYDIKGFKDGDICESMEL